MKDYVKFNAVTGELELCDSDNPRLTPALMKELEKEFAYEPLDLSTLRKMNQFIGQKLEKQK